MKKEIKITDANLISAKSDSKRPEINKQIGQYLLDSVKGNNDSLSKSMVVYELLLYSRVIPFEDSVTKLENNINSQLESNGVSVDDVNDFNIKDIYVYAGYDFPAGAKKRMQVTFPEPVFDSVPWERKWAEHIEKAVEYYLVRQFDSRHHRIEVKTDLLGLVTDSRNKLEVDDLAAEIYDEVVSPSKFNVEHIGSLNDKAHLCDSVDEKKQLLAACVTTHGSASRKLAVNTFIDAFDYTDKYRAHKICNEAFEEYELYEYNKFDKHNLIDIEFLKDDLYSVKSHDEPEYVLLQISKRYAQCKDGENKIFIPRFRDIGIEAKILKKNASNEDFSKLMRKTAEEHDVDIDVSQSKIYFE